MDFSTCTLHCTHTRGTVWAYLSASSSGLPGISSTPFPNSHSEELREESLNVHTQREFPQRMQFCPCLLFVNVDPWNEVGDGGALQTVHSPAIIKGQIFQKKFGFISFMYILNLILATFVFLLTFALVVSIKFKDMLVTKLNRFTSQSSQTTPHFPLQSAVSWLSVWSCVPVSPDLSSCSILLLTAKGFSF